MFPDFVSAIAALKAGRVDGALQTAITAATTVKSSNDPTIGPVMVALGDVANGASAADAYSGASRGCDVEVKPEIVKGHWIAARWLD